MTQHHVAVVDGMHTVYATETGRDRHYLRAAFTSPRAAIHYAEQLNGQASVISPLRASGTDSLDAGSSPTVAVAESEPEPRKRRLPARRTGRQ